MTTKNKECLSSLCETISRIYVDDACLQLNGLPQLTRLNVSVGHKLKFQRTAPHALCGCYSCMELAKIFISDEEELKDAVIEACGKAIEN